MVQTVSLDEQQYLKLASIAKKDNLSIADLLRKAMETYEGVSSPQPKARRTRDERRTEPTPQEDSELLVRDLHAGSMSFKPSKRRLFLMTARAWNVMEEALFNNLLKGAPPLVFEMGKAYGGGLAEDYITLLEDPSSMKDYFERMASFTGWGRVDLQGDTVTGKKLVIRVENCLFCESRASNPAGRESCYFLMGVCKGIVDVLYDWPHTVRETKCRLKGESYCEIVLESKTSFDSNSKNWGLRVYFPSHIAIGPAL